MICCRHRRAGPRGRPAGRRRTWSCRVFAAVQRYRRTRKEVTLKKSSSSWHVLTMTQPVPAAVGDSLADVATPALIVELDAFERNIAKMAALVGTTGVRL